MPLSMPPTFAGGFSDIALGAAGTVLTSNGAGLAPSFEAPAAGGATFLAIVADEPRNTAIANDNNLKFSALAAGTYFVSGMLLYTTAVGTAFQLTMNLGGTDTTNVFLPLITGTAIAGAVTAYGSAVNAAANTGEGAILMNSTVTFTSAGNTIVFAWGTGTVGNTVTLKAGSFLSLQKVA